LPGVWAREVPQKVWHPLLISTTVEGSDFKFGIQLGLRGYHTKPTFTNKNGVGVGAPHKFYGVPSSHPCTPIFVLKVVIGMLLAGA